MVHMPVVLALEKNSPLKPRVDEKIRQLSEGGKGAQKGARSGLTKLIFNPRAGLIAKWLKDAISRLPAEEQAPQEALMNLRKFWSSFVALGIGYLISICAILAEHWHFRHIVMRHPVYDVYNPSLYYNFKRLYPGE